MSDEMTELLCKLLDERGIEWKDGDASHEIEWSTPDGRLCSAMYWKPMFTVLISGCTPEQAIAATLGEKQRDKTEEWLLKACNQATQDYVAQLERERDELKSKLEAATLGGGECRNEWAEFGKFRCSECGLQVDAISTNTTRPMSIMHCPNCGRRVKR